MKQVCIDCFFSPPKLDQHLPIIVPVIIYNGYQGWNFSVQFEDLFQLPSKHFRDFIPKFRHILHDIGQMDEASFKTTTIMEIFHLLLKYIYYPELDAKIQDIYDLLEKLPDNDKLTDYLFIIARYILASGSIPEKRLLEYTKRFSGGEKMIGVAAREIEERVERTKKPYWEKRGEIKATQEMLIKSLKMRFDLVKPTIKDQIRSIQNLDTVNDLFELSFKCSDMDEFIESLSKVT
ncbi:hypothetical protein AKJ60_00645 [candidate division MSBL1 archaeon SCGC-AAA385M11]|nr:hypothetical protein AKJ60_00645 [candidate division MSBL1 archaeon SCGC-AAA385M11]